MTPFTAALNSQAGMATAWRWQAILPILLLLLLLSGCQTSPRIDSAAMRMPAAIDTDPQQARTLQLLYHQHADWRGTPYRSGGQGRSGIDCSAFVQRTFRDLFAIDLPRTTSQQAAVGRPVARSALQAGDLVFFHNGGHVGIYLENNRFLHASTTRGVMISSLENSYWSRHYWRALSVQRPAR